MRRRAWLSVVGQGIGLAGWLAVAGCSARETGPPADLLVTNAQIYAADGSTTLHESLAVRGDRIVAIGAAAEVARHRGPETIVLDAAGRSVVPGFRHTPDPVNGTIVRDRKTGEPTGVLQESAQGLVSRLLPEPTDDERLAMLDTVTTRLHAAGVTSVQNALGSEAEFGVYDRARQSGRLGLRIYSAVAPTGLFSSDPPAPITSEMIDGWDALRRTYAADASFKLGMVKLFVDGVIETHTATLLAPYANRPTSGPSNYTPAELARIVTLLDGRGWQVMMHAVGDGAVRMALDAVTAAAAANPAPARGRRHRIDHLETLDPADEPRFGRLGVVASMHPGGIYRPPGERPRPVPGATPVASVWAANLGPERAARGGAWKRIRDAGGRVTLGSDWPVASYDPSGRLYQVAVAAPWEGRPDGRLSLMAAIDAYTSDAAYVEFEEGTKGTLVPGQLADFVILAKDVFTTPPTSPADLAVVTTVFGGKVVFGATGNTRP